MSLNSHLEVLTFNTKLIENNSGVRRVHGWTAFDLNDAMAHHKGGKMQTTLILFDFLWFFSLSLFILLSFHGIRHVTFDVCMCWLEILRSPHSAHQIQFHFYSFLQSLNMTS